MQDLRCSESTPSQRLAAAARRERLAKIARAAHPDTPVSCPSASLKAEKKALPPEPVFSSGEWVERQKIIHTPWLSIIELAEWVDRQKTIRKAPWFSIVGEIDNRGRKITKIDEIQRAVCKYFGVSRIALSSARRTVDIVRPRQVGYYLSKMLTGKSLPEIGRRFGNRDHTSILSGVRKIERLRATDQELNNDILTITASLGATA